jgi:hypothetical protein
MGKGQIVSGGEDGLYTVKVLYDRHLIQARITIMTLDIAVLAGRILTLDGEIADAETAYYNASHTSPLPKWSELYTLRTAITVKQAKRALLALYREALYKKIDFLSDPRLVPADTDVSAWCADLTENLTGEVGLIEVNGEPGTYLIQPGHSSNATYNKARDGQVQAILGSSPAGAFFNKAMMPGWQKWKPTYRIGTIEWLDTATNKCMVTLDPALSREVPQHLSLNINQATLLTDVPISYMT